MQGKAIMIQGTMSNSGKSFVTAGICRALAREGFYKVAPFKAQNMSSISHKTKDGMEMSRAQAVQAEAAMTEPIHYMNPILLKPTSNITSEVIVNGVSQGEQPAAAYYERKDEWKREVQRAFRILSNRYDRIVIEGAGSPAEINLSDVDLVNMGMAKMADAPVILVADIDRGGVFASIYGTVKLLPTDQQKRIKGIIINKFRGDKALLESGLSMIENLTGIPVIGVIPMAKIDIEEEDSLSKRNYKFEGIERTPEYREEQYEKLADLICEHVDMDFVRDLFELDEYANLPEECRSCSAVGCGGKKDSDEGMGRVHVYYGPGKGKTTTALGVALRCAGAGYKILIHSFISSNTSSEVEPLAGIPNITRVPSIPLKRYAFMMNEEEKAETKAKNDKKLDELMELAKSYDMLILDEIIYAIEMDLLSEDKLIEYLVQKPCQLEIVLTGRTPSERLIEVADYASEIKKVKHPFDFGLSSRLGIER